MSTSCAELMELGKGMWSRRGDDGRCRRYGECSRSVAEQVDVKSELKEFAIERGTREREAHLAILFSQQALFLSYLSYNRPHPSSLYTVAQKHINLDSSVASLSSKHTSLFGV